MFKFMQETRQEMRDFGKATLIALLTVCVVYEVFAMF